jgi:hypothetical protein
MKINAPFVSRTVGGVRGHGAAAHGQAEEYLSHGVDPRLASTERRQLDRPEVRGDPRAGSRREDALKK